MENSKSPQDPDIMQALFGDGVDLCDEEVSALFEAVAPEQTIGDKIYALAEKAAVSYRTQQKLPPEHVQAALNATRKQTSLEITGAALKKIVSAIKAPALGPVWDPSFAFHKRDGLTENDRRILEEQTRELSEDWEENIE